MSTQKMGRFVQVRARMRDAAKAELAMEEGALSDCDRQIEQASEQKLQIMREMRDMRTGASSVADHARFEAMLEQAERQRVGLLNTRMEQEKKTVRARQHVQQAERELQRSRDMLRDAQDARELEEQKEIEALPRTFGGLR